MSYRYNTIDIIVGVGMCAILFGALLLFLAVNGTYQAVPPHILAAEQSAYMENGAGALQSAIGRAIVDQALIERQSNQVLAHSVSEWNRITMTHHDWESGSSGWLGNVLKQGMTVPADHLARLQGVMGLAIVNFTKRGVRNGLLSADQYATMYNMRMISTIESEGQRLHNEFASTWQALLGHRIVEAAQHDWLQAGAIQERLGSSLVQVVHAQMKAEKRRTAHQEQLASLIVAAARSEIPADLMTPSLAPSISKKIVIASTEPASWPEIPMSYLMAAGLLLATVFWGGLSLAVQSREAKAIAQRKQDIDRWAFRMAA
ncbi:hypothetical protein [Nitrospira sp. BLG_1]|uniref:hypothetical protein n=1 Tax=Nitrospira sp. BLG_1 TaxID=3395883 RepID=UPI0039BC88D6